MRTIRDILTAKKYRRAAVVLAEHYLEVSKKYRTLQVEHERLLDTLAAERRQKERYRVAFLKRMNVPIIGKAWDGNGNIEES